VINIELFNIFGTISIKDDEAKRKMQDMDNRAEKSARGISKTGVAIGSAFGNIIAQGVMKLGSAMAGIGPSLVQAAASAQALNAQFEQVFGDAQKGAQDTINALGKDFGMVPDRIKPAMTQMTSMFKGLGMDTEDAMGTAKDAVTMVADAAAFYDMSFENANGALNSFIKGNYEGGEAIGLFANETQMAAYASKELGLDWKNLDEAGKQVARLEFAKAMQESAGATGQAARESNSLENQLGNLRQAWENIKAKFGEPILEPAVAAIQKMAEWLQNVDTSKVTQFADWVSEQMPVVEAIFDQVFTRIGEVLDVVWAYFKDNILPVLMQVYSTVSEFFPLIQDIFVAVFQAVWEVLKTVWDFISANLLPIFSGLFSWVQGHMPTIRATMETVFNKIKEVAQMVWAFFKDNILPILERFLGFIQSKMPQIQSIVEAAFNVIKGVIEAVWSVIEDLLLPILKALWDWISPHIPKVQSVIEDAFSAIFNAVDKVVGVFNDVVDAVKRAIDWLTQWNNKEAKNKSVTVTENRVSGGIIGGSPVRNATGTNYFRGGATLVGEMGPELVELPRGSKINPANETKRMLQPERTQKQPVIIQMLMPDSRVFAEYMVDDITDMQSFKQGRLQAFGGGV
jgi:hypothetical protein